MAEGGTANFHPHTQTPSPKRCALQRPSNKLMAKRTYTDNFFVLHVLLQFWLISKAPTMFLEALSSCPGFLIKGFQRLDPTQGFHNPTPLDLRLWNKVVMFVFSLVHSWQSNSCISVIFNGDWKEWNNGIPWRIYVPYAALSWFINNF